MVGVDSSPAETIGEVAFSGEMPEQEHFSSNTQLLGCTSLRLVYPCGSVAKLTSLTKLRSTSTYWSNPTEACRYDKGAGAHGVQRRG